MQNATDPPSKRSKIERKMDKIIYILFSSLVVIAFTGSLFFGINTRRDISGGNIRRWYLRPDHSTVFYDPKRPALATFFHFLTALMLYGYLIPISLERALANRKDGVNGLPETGDVLDHASYNVDSGESIKGFNFRDERIMNGQWVNEPHSDIIQKFLRVLAICHTAIPVMDKASGEITYESESPEGILQINEAKESSNQAKSFGLIIDGKSLEFCLKKDVEKSFLELAITCASAICCRSTPKQKALLLTSSNLIELRKMTLSVGNGANDVGMLQKADIGVGISVVEGMQVTLFSLCLPDGTSLGCVSLCLNH
ncbi:phospholipid-transporting ATPase 8 [Pyrus ussuriensis x Pyrus communis]|uniref:Phospholipid-transporting ATPase 8 n=1 Tax=Pyrus ussuriensis x Pyrus communis TaxID=2448454 RepID=A0A5N5F8X6_9ROSA|nr:phospholipid-transporting ATPase 8 [Pyrus ussuriensis x Pyrus communis]